MLRQIPGSNHPSLLVGFETSDDAGVFRVSEDVALVQTVDFFTPVVDDPYAYGQIAAANALSDVYAMGGRPISVLNLACFDPDAAPAEVWAAILTGMADKTHEAGAVVMGGHSVMDTEPKFGMAVTGTVHPVEILSNREAKPGQGIYLSKPLGTGIIATAAKFDACPADAYEAAVDSMRKLNRDALDAGRSAGVRCATDITGFGLAGHLFNVARASGVQIEIDLASLPLLPHLQELIAKGHTTGGGAKNREFLDDALLGVIEGDWRAQVALDPQTSGGLALFSDREIPGMTRIGTVVAGEPSIRLV